MGSTGCKVRVLLLHVGFFLVWIVSGVFVTVESTPVVDEDNKGFRYEEYLIEHEISSAQAKKALMAINFTTVATPPGCQACTQDEITYCLGRNLINDHCCCDKRYHEVLPFIPHTCYWGTTQCRPIVDCAEYNRLRRCCCDKYVLEKFVSGKEKSRGAMTESRNSIILLCVIYNISRCLINYLKTYLVVLFNFLKCTKH